MLKNYLATYTSILPLALFRVLWGILLFISIARFYLKGWIADLYIKPHFFFSYYGFEWVKPLGNATYFIFALCALAALCFTIGLWYRLSATVLFLSFTYIELMDKTTYLNHYYFVSLVSFLFIFLPAHRAFSVAVFRNKIQEVANIKAYQVDVLKLLICVVYFYAGLAKLNSDWLCNAMPLRIWLPAKNDMPILGWLFNYQAVAYLFSYVGCLYDLAIPFLLWNKRTVKFGFFGVVVFHLLTAILFPIGVFPYVMIVAALFFFPRSFHEKALAFLKRFLPKRAQRGITIENLQCKPWKNTVLIGIFASFLAVQLVFPWRYLAYPGELFWTEEGYRFSWRVMLIEKLGYAQFKVKDAKGNIRYVNNSEFLTPLQEKMMATQADMILQYAHFLKSQYEAQGFIQAKVYATSYVSLNGRLGKQLVNDTLDLTQFNESFLPKTWILPLNDAIKGL